jgi:hypothetical protein
LWASCWRGELGVVIAGAKKAIPCGSLLGELSFFEGGRRTAAVSSNMDSIVGMITFNELEQLNEHAPILRLKLMVMFALEGIRKMRMMQTPSAPAPDAPLAGPPRFDRRASTTRRASMQLGAMASAPVPSSMEALFRVRMKNEEGKYQEQVENLMAKRKKAARKAYNAALIADTYQRESERHQQTIGELEADNYRLKQQLEARDAIKDSVAGISLQQALKIDELQANLQRLRTEALARFERERASKRVLLHVLAVGLVRRRQHRRQLWALHNDLRSIAMAILSESHRQRALLQRHGVEIHTPDARSLSRFVIIPRISLVRIDRLMLHTRNILSYLQAAYEETRQLGHSWNELAERLKPQVH